MKKLSVIQEKECTDLFVWMLLLFGQYAPPQELAIECYHQKSGFSKKKIKKIFDRLVEMGYILEETGNEG